MRFADRTEAGRRLAGRLKLLELASPVVLALPRGGVPVGFEVACALDAPLEVLVARKIGAPGHREFGIGAIAENGAEVVDRAALHALGLSEADFRSLVATEREELERRIEHYRGGRPLTDLRGREAVLVDDGLATGVTAEAALLTLRSRGPRRLVLGAPACALDTLERLQGLADEVVCITAPADFVAVGRWYENFEQTTDAEVLRLLELAASRFEPESPTPRTSDG